MTQTLRKLTRLFPARPGVGGALMDRRNVVLAGSGELSDRDPFILMDEEWMQKPKGFPPHPHAGFEAITYVLEGGVEHWNNHGDRAVAQAGDAQWMIAGRGIVHSEMPHGDDTVHLLQLWVNLPAATKKVLPRYQFLPAATLPEWRERGVRGRVIAGHFCGLSSPMPNAWPVALADVQVETGAIFREAIPGRYNTYLYVLSGGGTLGIDGTAFRSGHVINFGPSDDLSSTYIELRACESMRIVLWAGPLIRETVVSRDGFVMSTAEEIEQAQKDYDDGGFDPSSNS